MISITRIKSVARQIATDEYIDLYILGITAFVFTILGFLGISDIKVLSSVILALLAVLAFSQIRSRKNLKEITSVQRLNPLAVFQTDFPDDLVKRRTSASNLLLIGVSMGRTVQGGSRVELRQLLQSGGSIHVLLVDPTNDDLIQAASNQRAGGMTPERLKRRILNTIDELTALRNGGTGDLQIRVAPFIPPMGINLIDAGSPSGLIVAQHYEHKAAAEAAPIITIQARDGFWYDHLAAEANRMWEDGVPWPTSARYALARSSRPPFKDTFGTQLEECVTKSQDLIITGVTRNTLVMSNYNRFEELLRGGCKIRFLLVEPSSEAVATAADRYYAERSPDTVRERVGQTLRLLSQLHRSTAGQISVRLTSYPLAMGLIGVDTVPGSESELSTLFIEYYSYQAQGEPKFILQPSDGQWFKHFLGEADALWIGASEYELETTQANEPPHNQ